MFIYILSSSVAGRKNPLIANDKAVTGRIYFHINHVSAGIVIVQTRVLWFILSVRLSLLRRSYFIEVTNDGLSVIHLHQCSDTL